MTDYNPPEPAAPPPAGAPPAAPVLPYMSVPQQVDPRLLRQFRQQIHALGGLWIVFGCLALGFAVYGLSERFRQGGSAVLGTAGGAEGIIFAVILALGALWLTVGIFACMKQMWAVYVGLGLTYLSVLLNLARINLCGIIIMVLIILQAHRVIGWAGKMRAVGVPLNAKP